MSGQNFIDYVKIYCRSGSGGAGSAHFHRDRRNPKGGPDGGDGGRGGHILLKGNNQLWTLLHLKYRKHVVAGNGKPGGSSLKKGADGDDVVLEVPLGTAVKDGKTGKFLFEILDDGQEEILVEGGLGGLGNAHFKSPTRQAPTYAQPGIPGTEEVKILELKVLADVGLVGFPNAGKSTMLSVLTAAKPKIASYPFTTLVPNLGIVSYRDFRSFVIADIPGIIENAHQGKGLGHRFLRHIERNAVLLITIPCDADSIGEQFEVLTHELSMYSEELLHKPRILAITKCDLIDAELQELLREEIPPDIPFVFISAVSGQGLQELKDLIWKEVESQRSKTRKEDGQIDDREGVR